MDLFTRQIVGGEIMTAHSSALVIGALRAAIRTGGVVPRILHSDQGSEYLSRDSTSYAGSLGIRLSMSRKSSTWENGYQEAFYSQSQYRAKPGGPINDS